MPNFMSPTGEVLFADLYKANTKYNREGVYSVTIQVDPSTTEFNLLREQLEALEQDYRQRRNVPDDAETRWPFEEDIHWETKKPNGLVRLKAKLPATQRKSLSAPAEKIRFAACDANREKITLEAEVARGTKLRFGGESRAWYDSDKNVVYISLRFKGVQIFELVELGSGYDPDLAEETSFDFSAADAVGAAAGGDPFEDES